MSTIVSEREANRPIYHPLDRLRGTIRRFVIMDGLLTAALFVIVAFWAGLAFDYGIFRLTSVDWVQDAPWGLRLSVLLVGVAILVGLVVTRVLLRLNREFSYPALALVLEKRYPKLLGDRLITAVELADVQRMARYGYSEEMILRTIDEARERVEQVPVESVFNWRRLWTQAILLVGIAVGVLALSFAGYSAFTRTVSPGEFAWRFGDVVTIWGERNLLLWNTPWPRNAHLELIGFPGDELRIGKDAPAPTIKARAVEWVIADRGTREGWRPLTVGDLSDLGIYQVTKRDNPHDLVDSVYTTPASAEWADALAAAVARPSMSRTIRRLTVPTSVMLTYRGEKTGGTVSFTRDQSGVFSGDVTGLKESVRFIVRGDDFATASKLITLLPPPMLTSLSRTEYQPAYLYHPAPLVGADVSSLRPEWEKLVGLRQVFPDKALSLTGDRSVFSVSAGTGVEITGTSDKPLKSVKLKYKAGKPADSPEVVEVPVTDKSFTISFRDDRRITETVEFELTLYDHDDVESKRSVLIQSAEDQPPQVETAIDVLRRQGNVFLCTPMALVPFVRDSVVRDDYGLSKVEFEYTVTPVESPVVLGLQVQSAAGVWAFPPLLPNLGDAVVPFASATSVGRLSSGTKKEFGLSPAPAFVEEYERLPKYTPEALAIRLTEKIDTDRPDVVKQIKFDDLDTDGFDLERVLPDLRVTQPGEVQPRYRIELNIVATDTNYETGPKTGRNVEIVRLMVISEQDLLAEISKDEETQIARMDDLIKKLEEAQVKLNQVAERMLSPEPPADIIVSAAVRTLDTLQDIGKARDATTAVVTEYTRIRREAEVNRCNRSVLEKWDSVVLIPLPRILQNEFPAAEQTVSTVQSQLATGARPDDVTMQNARTALSTLIDALKKVREGTGDVVNINKLRDELRKIIEDQLLVSRTLKRSKEVLVDNLFNPQLLPVPPVTMAKGEKKTIKQGIDWKIFTDGSIQVKFEAPANSGLKLPPVLKVPDDSDDFTFEITAGQNVGEFPITLTPSVGSPVTIMVTVK